MYHVLFDFIEQHIPLTTEEKNSIIELGIIKNVNKKKTSEYYINCIEYSIILISDSSTEEEIFTKFPEFESLCRILS